MSVPYRDTEEYKQLEELGNSMVDKMLELCHNETGRDVLSRFRWLYVQGYIAGASDVLKATQDGAVALRTGFAKAQLEAAIAAKLGLG